MLPSHETVPLRHVPFSGYRTHLHVPYFAMGHAALAISWNLNVVALTSADGVARNGSWLRLTDMRQDAVRLGPSNQS